MAFRFSPNYKEWKKKFNEEPVYTRAQMKAALKKQKEELVVNRVVRTYTGRYGPDDCVPMKVVAVYKTPSGVMVLVE